MMQKIYIYILFLVLWVVFSACNNETALIELEPEMLSDGNLKMEVSYRNGEQLDVYYTPDSSKNKVLIFVHGGAWLASDKSEWTTQHAMSCLERNVVNVSVNYQFAQHPAQITDVSRAIKWVYDNIENYGGDKEQIYLMGYSAGAHIVSLLCTDETYLKQCDLDFNVIKGVCAYDGGNYMRQAETMIGSNVENSFRKVFGDGEDAWKEVLPYYHIVESKNIPPFLLIAERDGNVRQLSNQEFAQKLRDYGHNVEELYVSGLDCNHIGIFTIKFFEADVQTTLFNWILQ